MKSKEILGIAALLFSVFLLISCIQELPEEDTTLQEAACGNGKLEAGETAANCCTDAGCIGDQTCVENVCEAPSCEGCTYADTETGTCKEYECCDDAACPDNERCVEHACEDILCGYCKYIQDHECKPLGCCEDADCDDKDETTTDSCSYPTTKNSKCIHTSLNKCEKDADCNDNNATTKDTCYLGKPHECMHETVTVCAYNDAFCPRLCNYVNDNDCPEKLIECDDDDLECFTSALDDCATATVTWTAHFENRTVEMDYTTYISVEEKHDNKECEIFFRTEDVNLQFTDDLKEDLDEDYNYTNSQIDDLEEDAQDAARDDEGKIWRCFFKTYTRPVTILKNWDDGDYNIEDFDRDECDGDYFE